MSSHTRADFFDVEGHRIPYGTHVSIPFADLAQTLLTTCQICVLMRAYIHARPLPLIRLSWIANAIGSSLPDVHLQLRLWYALYMWLTEYWYRYSVGYSLHMRIYRPARCVRLCVMHTCTHLDDDADITTKWGIRHRSAAVTPPRQCAVES